MTNLWIINRRISIFFGFIAVANGALNGTFINPPPLNTNPHPVWSLGETQVISWATEEPVYNISIWQQNPQIEAAANSVNVFG
jgi:hypothetical protein